MPLVLLLARRPPVVDGAWFRGNLACVGHAEEHLKPFSVGHSSGFIFLDYSGCVTYFRRVTTAFRRFLVKMLVRCACGNLSSSWECRIGCARTVNEVKCGSGDVHEVCEGDVILA